MLNHNWNLFNLTVTIELSNTQQNNVDKKKSNVLFSIYSPARTQSKKMFWCYGVYAYNIPMTKYGEKSSLFTKAHTCYNEMYVMYRPPCSLLYNDGLLLFYFFFFLLVQYVWSQHYFYPCARHCAIPMYVWNTRHAQHASQCTTTCFIHTRKSNKKSNEMRQTKIYLNAVGILFFLHVCLYIKLCMYVKQSVFHIWRNSINICLILCYIFNKWEIQTQDIQQRNTTLTKLYRTTQTISPLWQGSVVWGHWKQYDVTEHYSMYIYLYIYITITNNSLSIYINIYIRTGDCHVPCMCVF